MRFGSTVIPRFTTVREYNISMGGSKAHYTGYLDQRLRLEFQALRPPNCWRLASGRLVVSRRRRHDGAALAEAFVQADLYRIPLACS